MPPVLSKETAKSLPLITSLLKSIAGNNYSALKIASVASLALSAVWMLSNQTQQRNKSAVPDLGVFLEKDKEGKNKTAIDKTFFIKLLRLLRILVPSVFCKESFLLFGVAVSLITRTYCDLWMISNGTSIENSIISRSTEKFHFFLLKFIWAMPLISVVNNALKYSLEELKLSFRSRLTKYLYSRYLNGFTYYWLTNIDNRISNPDQVLTQDVDRFCNAIVDLYSNLLKPVLDVTLYIRFLGMSMGFGGPARILVYLIIIGLFLTRLRRPVARMTVREQVLEGQFRFVNSRLISSAEEVAFYDGANREHETIIGVFHSLINHLRSLLHFRISMGLVDNIVAKYIATCVGYWTVSRPFLNLADKRFLNSTHDERLQAYYESGRMMYKMGEATGRIVLAGREMIRLAGFTDRVAGLVEVLDEVASGKFQRAQASASMKLNPEDGSEEAEENSKLPHPVQSGKSVNRTPGKVEISVSDDGVIRFQRIRLTTPNGDVLVPDLSFEVHAGANVLVTGPNGCGKSSLFRVLCGLWPAVSAVDGSESNAQQQAKLVKPQRGRLFYIPQKPYLCAGTLRDQIIYPDSQACMRQKGITDADLVPLLEAVQLSYVLDREGGFDSVKNWFDVLSGGEKQRIAMSRLFYHRPQFAILDECTSAVSADAEDGIYNRCRQLGITLFTVSHRKSLWKHHEFVLYMDGRGAFEFTPITEQSQPFGS